MSENSFVRFFNLRNHGFVYKSVVTQNTVAHPRNSNCVTTACAVFTNLWLRTVDIRAKKESPGEGKDLLDVHCITLKHQMALPMSYIYIPWVQ